MDLIAPITDVDSNARYNVESNQEKKRNQFKCGDESKIRMVTAEKRPNIYRGAGFEVVISTTRLE